MDPSQTLWGGLPGDVSDFYPDSGLPLNFEHCGEGLLEGLGWLEAFDGGVDISTWALDGVVETSSTATEAQGAKTPSPGWHPFYPISDSLTAKLQPLHSSSDTTLSPGNEPLTATPPSSYQPPTLPSPTTDDLLDLYLGQEIPSQLLETDVDEMFASQSHLDSDSPRPAPVSRRPSTSRCDRTKSRKLHFCHENLCWRSFETTRDLKRHHKAVHAQTIVPCEFCGKPLKDRPDNVNRHKRKYCKAIKNRVRI